ncbi:MULTISPECIES: sensor histidine kinase [unclassified Agromyces]|uniref:sensor histidine kinase n=1 Tax=unclassified Agromyces TaxID=2639701 RepID=UPI0030148FFF
MDAERPVDHVADEREALRAAAELIAGGASPGAVLEIVARYAAGVMDARYVAVLRLEAGADVRVQAAWTSPGAPSVVLDGWPLEVDPLTRELLERGEAVRDIRPDADPDPDAPTLAGRLGARSSIGVPIRLDDRTWGALFVHGPAAEVPDGAESRLEGLAQLIAAAVANAATRGELETVVAEQAALRRVAELVAKSAAPYDVFAAVAEEFGRLVGVQGAKMLRFEPDETATFVASWGPLQAGLPIGTRLPARGTSVTGRILATGRTARVDDYDSAEGPIAEVQRSAGMRSAVGAPIHVDGRLWGAMVVGSADSGLPPDTEARMSKFAELVSLALSNVDARTAVHALLDEQAALRRVATLVARGGWVDILDAILEEVARLLDVEAAAMLRYESDETATVVAAWGEPDMRAFLGLRLPVAGDNPTAEVLRTHRPARTERWDGARGTLAAMARELGVTTAVAGPITVENRVWGVIVVLSLGDSPMPEDTERRIAQFAELVATAIGNVESRRALLDSRARLVHAADEARRRLERDLHDGVQQRLVGMGLGLRRALDLLRVSADEAEVLLESSLARLGETLDQLRELSRGVHPAILSEGGLGPALRALARRSGIAAELVVADLPRLDEHTEVATYFVVSEALTNTVKHARASSATVRIELRDGVLHVDVADDGDGGADASRGSGLIGLVDRVEALGGSLTLSSPPGGGTVLHATLPAEAPSGA